MALLPTEEELLKNKLTDPFAGLTGLGGTVTGGAQALPGFDPVAERARREQLINLQATQGQEQIGRMFGLQPTGLQTGQAVARFAPIEAQRMGNLASLESELSQRGPAEARANLALQNQILLGQQGTGLQAGSLGLQGLLGYGAQDLQQQALTEQIAARQGQQSLQAGQLTGTYGGADTLQQQALLEQVRAQQEQERLALGGLTGLIGGAKTLQQLALEEQTRAQIAQEAIAGGQLTGLYGGQETLAKSALGQEYLLDVARQALAQEAQDEAERAAIVQEGLANAQLYGGEEGKLTLQAQVALDQIAETRRQALEQERLQRAQLTGYMPGEEGLSKEEVSARLGIPFVPGQKAEFIAEAAKSGYKYNVGYDTFDATEQSTVAQRNLAEGARQFDELKTIQEAGLTGKYDGSDTQQTIQASFDRLVAEAALTGNYADPETGDSLATLASKELTFREGIETGLIGTKETLRAKQLELAKEIERGQLALQADAQSFGRTVTEAELTGLYKSMGTANVGEFTAAFGTNEGDAGYRPMYDFDGNGNIGFDDFVTFGKISSNEAVDTLAGQTVAQSVATSKFQDSLAEAGITGKFGDTVTTQEQQRAFDNRLSEAQIFGGAPPVTFTGQDITNAYGSKQGDANYRADMDVDQNGTIDMTDYVELVNTNKRSEMLFPNADFNKMVMMYTPPGPQTLMARELGLDERKFAESSREWSEQFMALKDQWQSEFEGVLITDGGVAKRRLNVPEFDAQGNFVGYREQDFDVSGLDLKRFEEGKNQFEAQMDKSAEEWAQKMGLDWATMKADDKMNFIGLIVQGAIEAAKIGVNLARPGNSPSRQNPQNTSTDTTKMPWEQ